MLCAGYVWFLGKIETFTEILTVRENTHAVQRGESLTFRAVNFEKFRDIGESGCSYFVLPSSSPSSLVGHIVGWRARGKYLGEVMSMPIVGRLHWYPPSDFSSRHFSRYSPDPSLPLLRVTTLLLPDRRCNLQINTMGLLEFLP